MISEYYSNLYTTGKTISNVKERYMAYGKTIKIDEHSDLCKEPSEEEIKDSIFSFRPFKAPGLDGLHPFSIKNI